MAWTDSQTLVWAGVNDAVDYQVYKGGTTTLGYADFGVCADGLDADRTDTELVDLAVPAEGQALVPRDQRRGRERRGRLAGVRELRGTQQLPALPVNTGRGVCGDFGRRGREL